MFHLGSLLAALLNFSIMDTSMLDALGNTLWGVAGNMASTSLAAAKNKEMQKMVYEQQRQLEQDTFLYNNALAQQQRNWNLEDYERTLKDTSPEASVQRFKDAGLSSAAAAQAAGDIQPVTNPSSLPSVSTPSAPAPDYGAWNKLNFDILGSLRQVMALRKEKVEAENVESTQWSDIQGVLTMNQAKDVGLKMAYENLRYAYETNPYSASSLRYKMQSDSLLPQIQKLAVKQAEQNYKSAVQKYEWTEKFNPVEFKKMQEEIDNLIANKYKTAQDIVTSRSQQQLNQANVGVAEATKVNIEENTELTRNQIEGERLKNLGIEIENVLKQFGSPENDAKRISALVTSGVLPSKAVGIYLTNCANYVRTGRDTFSRDGDVDLRSVFVHDIAPGIGESDKVPVWSHGSLFRPAREARETMPKWLQDFFNSF